MHCANDIREILKAKDKKQIAVYGATGHHHGLEENYHLNFWCGSSTKSAFTLDMIRVVCLAQAIYVAVAVTTYVPQAFAASWPGDGRVSVSGSAVGEMHVPRDYVPASHHRHHEDASHLEDFTVASNIDTMVHHRILSNVQRRSKTVAAFGFESGPMSQRQIPHYENRFSRQMGEGSAGNVSKEFKERMAESEPETQHSYPRAAENNWKPDRSATGTTCLKSLMTTTPALSRQMSSRTSVQKFARRTTRVIENPHQAFRRGRVGTRRVQRIFGIWDCARGLHGVHGRQGGDEGRHVPVGR